MAHSSDKPTAAALARYLSAESSVDETAEVQRWTQAHPDNALEVERLRTLWAEGKALYGGSASVADGMWNAIAPEVLRDAATPALRVSPLRGIRRIAGPTRSRWRMPSVAAAAIAAIAIGVATYPRFVSRPQPEQQRNAERVYTTERGQRASLKLPDGSAVELGPQSTLRIHAGYASPARVLTLVGDAYFNVTHDEARPFIVHTARGEIHDLGTRFVIRARAGEDNAQVAVAEGKVAIGTRAGLDSLVIGAGELARIDATGAVTPVSVASIDPWFAWTEGRLVFDRAPLRVVLAELGRWYDEEFVLADPEMAKVRLTTVLRGETLSEALLVLGTALDADTRVRDDTVTIIPHKKTPVPIQR